MSVAIVETTKGPLEGMIIGGLAVWRGIPYAVAERWQTPRPAPGWQDVRDARAYGPRPIQPLHQPFRTAAVVPASDDPLFQSEDCLVLNISRPSDASAMPLPVFVWFHGGGYHVGSGPGFGVADGAGIARAGVVVVTVNYRLGALGFLRVGDRLGDADRYADSANLGMLDQSAALEWVHQNIARFGGDPARVTIGGLSAGGKSVMNHLAIARSRGLFHGVISQSGGDYQATPAQMDAVADAFFSALEKRGWPAHRAHLAPSEAILDAQKALGEGGRATWLWRPGLDGRTLHEPVSATIARGAAARVPLLAGTTARETITFQLRDETAVHRIPGVVEEVFGSRTDDVLRAYGVDDDDDAEALHALGADERYAVPTERILDAHTAYAPTYTYRFEGSTPGWPDTMRAIHASDLPLFWGFGLEGATDGEKRLSARMNSAWIGMICDGSPGDPEWPAYRVPDRPTLVFDDIVLVETDDERPRRALWRGVEWDATSWWIPGTD